MRWVKKQKIKSDIRYKKKFAWFPISVTSSNEVRWLETVYLKQKYWEDWGETGWENLTFLTKEEYENAITGAEIAKQKKVLSTLLCYGEKCNYWKDGKCHAFNPITANGKCITGKYYPTEIGKNDNTL